MIIAMSRTSGPPDSADEQSPVAEPRAVDAAAPPAPTDATQSAALRAIRRHADQLAILQPDALPANEAREMVRIDIAALEHITDPVLRRRALMGLQRCARSQRSYLAELREQL